MVWFDWILYKYFILLVFSGNMLYLKTIGTLKYLRYFEDI